MLICENQTLCIEDLKIKNMMKNHKLKKLIESVSWSKFNLETELENSDYKIILISPHVTETVLYDTYSDTKQKNAILSKGENLVLIHSDSVMFKSIDLSIDGLKESDF